VPYSKCVPCRIRVPATGPLTDGACPSCGRALEPVSRLTDVVGFRGPDLVDPSVPPRVAERVTDISGGRAVAEAQVEVDRWLDEGGGLGPQPLAQAVALDLTPAGGR
jgi:hypothetical protein